MTVEDHGTYVIKTERPGLPEAEKYRVLNAAGAPVVQLLDVIEGEDGRRLVLEKASPLEADGSDPAGFDRLLGWMAELASTTVPQYPDCNLDYVEGFWEHSSSLLALARDPTSPVHRPSLDALPSAQDLLGAYRRLVTEAPTAVSHGDPANANLGHVGDRLVAFDLGLSWLNNPFVDLVLRTGAQVTPYPSGLDRERCVVSYAGRLQISSDDPLSDYAVCGAIFGAYFEEGPVRAIRDGTATKSDLGWATLALDRFESFASLI